MKVEIREAKEDDCIELSKICKEELGYSCSSEFVRNQVKKLEHSRRDKIFVAVVEQNVVGVIHVEDYQTFYFDELKNILGLAVKKEYQGKKIGTRLLKEAENWAKETGAVGIRVNSGGQRKAAHAFYRAKGYENEKMQIRFIKEFTSKDTVTLTEKIDDDRKECTVEYAHAMALKYYDGEKYQHAMRVADAVKANIIIPEEQKERCYKLAIMHDLLEDTSYSIHELKNSYYINCLKILTKEKSQNYIEYIQNIKASAQLYPEAYWVKLADMKDHLAQKETLTERLKQKYLDALPELL